jgi:hypothetical protein
MSYYFISEDKFNFAQTCADNSYIVKIPNKNKIYTYPIEYTSIPERTPS